MNVFSSRLLATGRISSRHIGRERYMPTSIDVFAKARTHERLEHPQRRPRARHAPVLPGARGPDAARSSRWRASADHARLQQLPGPDRGRAGQAGRARRAASLRHRPDRIAVPERDDRPPPRARATSSREWLGTEAALVFTTGHQANLGALGTILAPGDTVIADSGDHASILDGCILSRAKLRAFRHNRIDRLEHTLEKAQADGGGILVVVDGVFSMEGDVAPLREIAELCRALRRPADGRRGPRARGARRARRRRRPSCSASRTRSTCGWPRSPSRWPRAAG